MAIEFKESKYGSLIIGNLNSEIITDGDTYILNIINHKAFFTIDELEQILSKMKELQNGKDNTISS